jgi:hypothetical protein
MKNKPSIPLQQSKLSLRLCSTFILAALAWCALPLAAHAACTTICDFTNTAFGDSALPSTSGTGNSAFGAAALASDSTGSRNTAVGTGAANSLYAFSDNTAVGYSALAFTSSGSGQNTAIGSQALRGITANSASFNTATGFQSLYSVSTGSYNTASGDQALYLDKDGESNTASGYGALYSNVSGNDNTALGRWALVRNTGSNNVGLGSSAGYNITTGNNNIVIGAGLLGNSADTNVTRIGKTTQKKVFIGGIRGITTKNANAVPVVIDSAGQLGTVSSSERLKKDIKPMEKASEGILSLKPVTFRYKDDGEKTPQFGLIAEEVAKVNPDLVVRDEDGQIYSVRYDAVNAMLLNEFLKEHRRAEEQVHKVEEQGARLAKDEKTIAQQQKQIKALSATVQRVSRRVELNQQTSRVVANAPQAPPVK